MSILCDSFEFMMMFMNHPYIQLTLLTCMYALFLVLLESNLSYGPINYVNNVNGWLLILSYVTIFEVQVL